MKKVILLTLTTLTIIVFGCDLKTKSERLILTKKSSIGQVVKFYYVEVGATANDVMQLRQVTNDSHEVLIKAYEHNLLKEVKFTSKDSLFFVLSDTTSFGLSKNSDTIKVKIK
ncbi:hypothetical protein [Mucilaginibacter sp.]